MFIQKVAFKIRAIEAQDRADTRIQRKYLFALQNKQIWLKAFTTDIYKFKVMQIQE